MNIISWNVNGIRALARKGNFQWLIDQKPDIFCLQETKAHVDQLEESVRNIKGYESFFVSPGEKKGYSGVAIYTKIRPISVEFGMGSEDLDNEGRLIQIEYKDFFLLNGYFPNGGSGPDRLEFKLKYYDAFLKHINKLKKQKDVIFCGDINTAHEAIDLARPKANEKNTGFLPEERAWIDEVVSAGFTDVFRHFYPNKKDVYTYWDMKTFSRERNVGWRIDYFFATQNIINKIKKVKVHSEVMGSDHCPIEIVL
jgi:exodeoxyribonuclease-3